jgi:vanillate O-demethylase monooxygenase subunit
MTMSAFVRNAWYPAAWSRDVGRSLSHRTILGDQVALYRLQNGEVAALEDLCPHRLAPLSMGKLKDDAVECGYHGMTFDCTGRCVRIPGQEIIPPSAKVRAYPIRENMGLVWVWMGVPELAAKTPVYDLAECHDSQWSSVEGDALPIGCNYLSLADNLCDPAHVSFVHLSTLGSAASEDIPVRFERKGDDRLLTWRWIMDSPAIPLFQKFGKFSGHVDRWHYYHYHAPSIAVVDFGSAPTGTGAPEGRRDNCIQIFACHFITPVDETSCIDHWLYVKNFASDEPTTVAISDQFRLAFNEDKVILEAIQKNEGYARGRRQIRLSIDASPVNMRRMVDRMIEAEGRKTAEDVTAA